MVKEDKWIQEFRKNLQMTNLTTNIVKEEEITVKKTEFVGANNAAGSA